MALAYPAVSVVVPTRNEAGNVLELVRRLAPVLDGMQCGWELVFADDWDDETPQIVDELKRQGSMPVVLVHRHREERVGGLGGAVQVGFEVARGTVLVVMDADLQHPPEIVPLLLAPILEDDVDLVSGNRYGQSAGVQGLDGLWRRYVSWGCRQLTHLLVPASRQLSDPLSGFFAIKRSVVDGVDLRPDGYKILLEIVCRGKWSKAANINYEFRTRYAGYSKATMREGIIFIRHLLRLALAFR